MPVDSSARHYDHAPILEALVGLQCELPAGTTLADVLGVHTRIKSEFPTREELVNFKIHIQPTSQSGLSSSEAGGYRLISADAKQVVRTSLTDFAYSRLAPYDRWETLREEAKRIWEIYADVLHPLRITRAAVRYINRVDIPDPTGEGVELDTYFRTAPRIAPELSQIMRTYFLRLELPMRLPNGLLIVTETMVQPARIGVVSTVLDIDCFVQNVDLDPAAAWQVIEELRQEKNAAFEACITEATRELIK